MDEDMADNMGHAFAGPDDMDMSHSSARVRAFSPPKTPAPTGLGLSLPSNRFPDWSLDSLSDSECESSRPSTARSTQTSASLFSQLSYASDGLSCVSSPTKEHVNHFDTFLSPEDANKTIKPPVHAIHSRRAPWTQPMSKHLWSTYMMYLQDPKVTPIRIGPSGVPPYGVVVRVAREARRSWRGSKTQCLAKNRSGSTTPTAEAPCPFVQWPHTHAATRAHLIEMCKANAGGKARNERYFARSPTPFGKTVTRSRARRTTPARSPSVFSSSDMALSLALSTSDSMQLGGPLAQLTGSEPQRRMEDIPATLFETKPPANLPVPLPEQRPRLGSPFVAKSYGPSSSSSLADALGMGSEMPRQSHTLGPRRSLRSPARLNRSRSNTQKRRSARQNMEPRRTKRPSLPSDMWSEPATSPIAPASDSNDPFSSTLGEGTMGSHIKPQQSLDLPPSLPPTGLSQSAADGPPRLGSPFIGLPSSFSFPVRGGGPTGIDSALRRPFATVRQSLDEDNTPRTPLPARLAYLDERLKQIRQRGEERRRSESPL